MFNRQRGEREIKVSIPLYMCNGVMNYGCPAPLSVVTVEKAMQCQLMCHTSEEGCAEGSLVNLHILPFV